MTPRGGGWDVAGGSMLCPACHRPPEWRSPLGLKPTVRDANGAKFCTDPCHDGITVTFTPDEAQAMLDHHDQEGLSLVGDQYRHVDSAKAKIKARIEELAS